MRPPRPPARPPRSVAQHPSPPRGERPPVTRDRRAGSSPGGGQTWLYGRHAVLAALANPERRVFRILATGESAERLIGEIAGFRRAGRTLPEPEIVARDRISEKLAPGAVHQGIAAAAGTPAEASLDDVLARCGQSAIVVLLDQITDPHNVGAILRSAEAFGAAGVIVTDRHAPEETGTLAKAASGALERMPLVRAANLARAMETLKAADFWIIGLDERGERSLAEGKMTGRVALALGAEGDGLRRLTAERCDLLVRLPMTGAMPSVNVSNAAAIALYELARH